MKYSYLFLLIQFFITSCSVNQEFKSKYINPRSLASIPTHNSRPCKASLLKVIFKPFQKNHIVFLNKGTKAVSAYDFADLIATGVRQAIDHDIFLATLINSPFAREMGVSPLQINEIVNISKQSKAIKSEEIILVLESYFKPYSRGLKKVTRVRDYDSALDDLNIENQCNFNSCWTFASVARLEHNFSRQLGYPVDLSEDYFYARYILNEVRALYHKSFLPIGPLISERGDASKFTALIPHFGIIPKGAFTAKKAFSSTDKNAFLGEIKEAVLKHIKAMAESKDRLDLQEELLKAIDKKVKSIIAKYVDDLDKEFTHEGVTYNAKSYYRKMMDKNHQSGIKRFIRDRPEEEIKYISQEETHMVRSSSGEITESIVTAQNAVISDQDIEDMIIFSINNKRPLFFAFNAPGENVLSGLRFVSLINKTTGKASLKDRLGNTIDDIDGSNPHAVLITGYEVDLNGRIKTIKVRNSSGTEYGDEGIIHMDSDFFWKYYMWITKS